MSAGTRIVRHLRLRAGHADGIRRAALLLEDALRTANLPDAGGRILLVRRLALGSIDPRAPPQRLALALERGIEKLDAIRVHGADSAAMAAAAVWFRDALEAHTLLALRVAADEPADAWFWPLAVPAWRRKLSTSESLRRLALSLAALPEAATALPQWTATLVRAGHGQRLATALHDEDLAPLAQAVGLRLPLRAVTPPSLGAVAGGRAKAAFLRALIQAADAAPIDLSDTAEPTLGAAPAPTIPQPTASDNEPRVGIAPRAAFPLQDDTAGLDPAPGHQTATGEMSPASEADQTGTRRTAAIQADLPRDACTAETHARECDPAGQAWSVPSPPTPVAPNDSATANPPSARTAPTEAPRSMAQPSTSMVDAATVAGGLLFLIPVLFRLGYPQWLEAQPHWVRRDVARRMFATVLARLAVAPADPAWSITARVALRGTSPGRFLAPARWRDGVWSGTGELNLAAGPRTSCLYDPSGRLLLAAWRGPRPRAVIPLLRDARDLPSLAVDPDLAALTNAAWLIACRRWLRRYACLGLADLVRRPAAIALTPTHVDVRFDHDQADLSLRRAGLDLDPGWVPWLGRVVSFQYGARGGR